MTWQWEPLQFSQPIDKNSFLVWKNSFVLQSRECKGPPQWLGSKGSTCHAGAAGGTGLPSGSGQVSRRRAGSPVQYPCLQNPMDRGAWRATVLRVTRSWTRQTWLSTYAPEKANCFHLACLHDYTDPVFKGTSKWREHIIYGDWETEFYVAGFRIISWH